MGIDDVVDNVVGGTTWGLGVAMVAGAALLVGKGGRPLAKQAIKATLILGNRVRELTAEATEQIEDIYAEARAELDEVLARDNGTADSDIGAASAASRAGEPAA
jgi:hypothetical protein